MSSKSNLAIAGLLIGVVLFFAVNILSTSALSSARLDMTEGKLYSLSEGSKAIARNLPEPVALQFFFSRQVANELPTFPAYARRVRELLEEYVRNSNGNLTLKVVEPEPFSEEEDQALQAGIPGAPVDSTGKRLFFGLVATSSTDDVELIEFFDPSRERFLEQDVSKMIYSLAHTDRRKVAVLSTLPLEGGPPANPMMGGRGEPPWSILEEMEKLFAVEMLDTSVAKIPDDTAVLMVVHPKGLEPKTQYAIDQFVLGGGNALVFVDPYCEVDMPADPTNQMAAFTHKRASDLGSLLSAWGVDMATNTVAADRSACFQRFPFEGRAMPHVAYLEMRDDNLNEDESTTALLNAMLLPYAGVLAPVEGASTSFSSLITTTEDSMRLGTDNLQFRRPNELLTGFIPDGEPLTVAALVQGEAESAFPEGSPFDPVETTEEAEAEAALDEDTPGEHRAASDGPINVIVVADADLLHDRCWIRKQNAGGLMFVQQTSENGSFVINCLDQLSGSDELISIRGGGQLERPFTLVEKIKAEADQQYAREVQDLEDKLRDAQQSLEDLERRRDGDTSMLLTPEQEELIEKYRQEEIETRKQLRATRHKMTKDIERLGTRLKILHVAVIPLLVLGGGFALWSFVRRQV